MFNHFNIEADFNYEKVFILLRTGVLVLWNVNKDAQVSLMQDGG